MTRVMPIDEVCFRITDALRSGRLQGWQRGFAASIAKNLKRPNWCPTAKQEWAMRRVIADLRSPDPDYSGEAELIDHEGGGKDG
jgi:hypothetical protein